MKTLFLVGCAKQKLNRLAPAQDLYLSPLFRKSRAYVESQLQPGDQWMILSARYGSISPTLEIAPYDLVFTQLTPEEQVLWVRSVFLRRIWPLFALKGFTRLVFLCGQDYQLSLRCCFAISTLNTPPTIEDPLAGLCVGQRLQWLTNQLKQNNNKKGAL